MVQFYIILLTLHVCVQNHFCVSTAKLCQSNAHKYACTDITCVGPSFCRHRLLADQYVHCSDTCNSYSIFRPDLAMTSNSINAASPGHAKI